MLRLARRHLKTCPHRSLAYRRCRCPVWIFGTREGRRVRRSLETTSWERGEELLLKLISDERSVPMSVANAAARWFADAEARKLRPESLKKYGQIRDEITRHFGKLQLKAVTADDLRRMREEWDLSPLTTRKRLEIVRSFFNFCVASNWIAINPARAIKPPVVKQTPTLPFTDAEWRDILIGLDGYCDLHPTVPEKTRKQLRALMLLMRHSGLRISDAVGLKKGRIDAQGRLFLYQAKTGQPVMIPLPKTVLDALNEADYGTPYYFWNGSSDLRTPVTIWQKRMKAVFRFAKVPDGHSHRLRDTFAVDLLNRGASVEDVAMLLGNTPMIVQKHYSPWVRSRQQKLEEFVKRTWA